MRAHLYTFSRSKTKTTIVEIANCHIIGVFCFDRIFSIGRLSAVTPADCWYRWVDAVRDSPVTHWPQFQLSALFTTYPLSEERRVPRGLPHGMVEHQSTSPVIIHHATEYLPVIIHVITYGGISSHAGGPAHMWRETRTEETSTGYPPHPSGGEGGQQTSTGGS